MSDYQLALEIETREGTDPEAVHVLMPNMAYACGGSILTKIGHFTVGPWPWDAVTCPDCLALGEATLVADTHAQQGRQQDVQS